MTTVKLLAVTLVAPLAFLVAKPPKAWVVTLTGRHQLGFSTYCWSKGGESVCVDYLAPTCGGTAAAPTIFVRRGERVRFELGFTPRSVSVSVGRDGAAHELAPTRRPTWRASRAGPLSLFVDAKTNGDATYVACIVFRR
jgi:hypothetical protein